ncbi:hypothetical protein NH44784_042141 [Achromobacter xylosoxidans NH44784-1996]|nr:hypothetical protein NH44784_042141 [Achromobacter xylosoxidans NH44784-1996]
MTEGRHDTACGAAGPAQRPPPAADAAGDQAVAQYTPTEWRAT